MTYGVNILVTPKSGDLYKSVAVNSAPIFIQCATEERLKEILLANEQIADLLRRKVKTNTLKKSARFCYRSLEDPQSIHFLDCNL